MYRVRKNYDPKPTKKLDPAGPHRVTWYSKTLTGLAMVAFLFSGYMLGQADGIVKGEALAQVGSARVSDHQIVDMLKSRLGSSSGLREALLRLLNQNSGSAGQRPGGQPTTSTGEYTGVNSVTMTTDDNYRYITSNGIPDHETGEFPNDNNPNSIYDQSYEFRMALNPVAAENTTDIGFNSFGVALNGVPYDPSAAEFWNNDRNSGWQYEAIGGTVNLGLDNYNAHVQPNGAYHYHGDPEAGTESTLVGYAADGFPIYSAGGNYESSYAVKDGERADGPGGNYDGTYVEDYEYVAGSGDLDQCNGIEIVTDDYPDGTYAYILTTDFPYIPRCFTGSPDASFSKQATGGGEMGEPGQHPDMRPGDFPPRLY